MIASSEIHAGEFYMLKVGEQTREHIVLAELQHDRFLVEDRYAHCHVREKKKFIATGRKLKTMLV